LSWCYRTARVQASTIFNKKTGKNRSPVGFDAVVDSGAQSDLWSLEKFLQASFSKQNLSPVVMSLNAANKSPIAISRAFFATITGTSPTGGKVTCRSMIYVSPNVKRRTYQLDSQVCDDSSDQGKNCHTIFEKSN